MTASAGAVGPQTTDRYRILLTPAGIGALSLFMPGLVVAGLSHQRLFSALSVGAGLLLVANLVVAWARLQGVTVSLVTPVAATVGVPTPVTLTVSGSPSLVGAVAVEHGVRPWIPVSLAAGSRDGEVAVVIGERGMVDEFEVRVFTAAPFGLTSCIRCCRVPLIRPLAVAPAPEPTVLPVEVGAGPAQGPGGDPIGLRPFGPGDTRRDVHWPSVARTGAMVVRDRHRPEHHRVRVVVDAPGPGDGLDLLLGRVRHGVDQLLAAGWRVDLTTTELASPSERGRPVAAPVTSADGLATRLARVAGGGPPAPTAAGVRSPVLVATAEEPTWRWIS